MIANFILLVRLILQCMLLFLWLDAVSVFLASLIVYFKIGCFSFFLSDVFSSFFESGYAGGLGLAIGLWIKIRLQERSSKKDQPK
ncbi:hypothetical protein GKQ23_14855 [Erwinia sp. E602]|uniref:hypothetical protein n=1 Tax=Erwinia sp. E602 TaxID=2675378 RepID=UPI001BA79CE0|nr:hypothetical protein [Erwinia sp. E602]QUG76199.1 hypothetical protein GKQ23_14855 [Erwinia sp. E602]